MLVRAVRVALILCIFGVPSTGPVASAADDFTSAWPDGVARPWIGSAYFANRWQDWRLRDGRVECLASAARTPARTVHLLTRHVSARAGTLDVQVRTGPIGDLASRRGWSGFLIGAGGAHVDPRLSALVHHLPAEDGGLLVVVDENGMVSVRDFSSGGGSKDGWSIRGPLDPALVPELTPARRVGAGFDGGAARPVRLRIVARPEPEGTYAIEAVATDDDTGRMLSEVEVIGVDASLVDGNVALVSHGGAAKDAGGHWFDEWTVAGDKVDADDDGGFGPVLVVLYTVSDSVLALTAQLAPFGPDDAKDVRLEVRRSDNGPWNLLSVAQRDPSSHTARFRVEGWDATAPADYRIIVDADAGAAPYAGVVQAEPEGDRLKVGSLTCHKVYTGGLRWNHDGVWFPHNELVRSVAGTAPDLLYFSGDQIYEGDLTPAQRRPEAAAILDYLYKWSRWCWSFGELTRNTPTICIPDDHDVYHGNIWGAGGRAARARDGLTAQDSGGYVMTPTFVNVVHRTQTSHLPAPIDPAPVEQGISVYFTRLEYGGVSFAIVSDRQFKSAPAVMLPDAGVKNGWFQKPDFDPTTESDAPDAQLLGVRQERFLEHWANDWSHGAWMKVLLSQSLFANLATIPAKASSGSAIPGWKIGDPHEYPEATKLAADTDSNGWPQSARNRALRSMRRGSALHITGDQHLGAVVRYGIDTWNDAGYAFSTPAIANTWPRRWFPPEPGRHRLPGAPPNLGEFLDGFGNPMTVQAVGNPVRTGHEPAALYDRAPGFGVVHFDRARRTVRLDCWPRWVDPAEPGARQFPGWPITLHQSSGDGRVPTGVLPRIHVLDQDDPVVQVVDEATGEIIYTVRVQGRAIAPWVYGPGSYTVRIGEPGTPRMRAIKHLRPAALP